MVFQPIKISTKLELLIFISCLSFATLTESHASRISSMISHLGNVSHYNKGGSFQDQSTGHYTAGGLMVKQRNRSFNPINIQLPHASGSCGDFDLRLGGISFIQGKELLKTMKAVMRGVPAYAFQLALKTVAPQIAGSMEWLQNKLEEINALLLDECHMRQQLLEGVLPTGSAMHEKVCEDLDRNSGDGLDFFGSRQNCQDKQERNEKIDAAREKYKDLLVGEYNLVWTTLKTMKRYKDDPEEAERIMSLVGTVVSKKEGDDYLLTFLDPKADDMSFIQAHVQGGETEEFICNDYDKCLGVASSPVVISKDDSLAKEVVTNINSMIGKYRSEEKFEEKEMVFLSDAVNLPIYKYIQISAAAYITWPLERVSHYFAHVILMKQFEDVAAEVLRAVSVLEKIQVDTKVIQAFKGRIELVRTRLQEKMASLDAKEMYMIEKLIQAKEFELRANYDLERRL